jgi:hypothetical protein
LYLSILSPQRIQISSGSSQNYTNSWPEEVEFLAPVALGSVLPQADAVVFPQMLGEAYRRLADLEAIHLPMLVITSEFGTVSMWDWEINSYLASKGIRVLAPPSIEHTRKIIRNLQLKKELQKSRFLVFQDNPGEGMQADIFKRFYWWEDECLQAMKDKFGVTVVKKSFQALAQRAKEIPNSVAEEAWQSWKDRVPLGAISHQGLIERGEDLPCRPGRIGSGAVCYCGGDQLLERVALLRYHPLPGLEFAL